MLCYTLYIFDRHGSCQYYHEWSRQRSSVASAGGIQEEFKLLFGLVWSLKALSATMDPTPSENGQARQMGTPLRIGEACSFKSFCTETYKLHFYESPSGTKIVLTTSPEVGDLEDCLQYIYSSLFVEYVVKNPEYVPGDAFLFENFTALLNKYMMSLNLIQ